MFWVVDGLDEAESHNELLKYISKIKSVTRINILFLSRLYKEISQSMDQYLPMHVHEHILSDDTFEDIGEYVRTSIRQIFSDNHSCEVVVEKILHKAAGSFLWVKLALDRMKRDWHTQDGIEVALDEIPEGMEPMYRGMIENIARKPSKHRSMATRMLTWIACSFRPLEVLELEAALAPEFTNFVNLGPTIEEVCGQFAVVSKGKITLIHETARTFLLQKTSSLPIQIDGHLGHRHAAEVCINFLSDAPKWRRAFDTIQTLQQAKLGMDPLSKFDEHPFLIYSLFYWSYHVRHAPVDSDELLEKVLNFLETFCLLWINGVALSRDLRVFIKTAENLKTYIKRRTYAEKNRAPTSFAKSRDVELRQWATDIIRVVG